MAEYPLSAFIAGLNSESQVLARGLFDRFPEWLPFAQAYEPVDPRENESDLGSLYLQVPSPVPKSRQYLGVHHRGDTFEVFHSDGEPPGPAEAQFIFASRNVHEVAAAAVDLLAEIAAERIVLGRDRTPRFLRFGDNQQRFIPRKELTAKRKRGLASITSWRGTFDEVIA
ncbi:MAG: hypothetical protein ACR2HB_15955 [Dehalococcoidia bacterium]